MKKCFLSIMLVLAGSLLIANEYEPKKLDTEINDNVGMYLMGIVSEGLGVTAIQLNGFVDKNHDILITSAKSKKFKISKLQCTSMVQALDAKNNEVAYMVTTYTLKQASVKKVNLKIKKNRVYFTELLSGVGDNDLDSEIHGTDNPPDPKTFTKLRNLQVYDIFITTEDNEEIHLQIYMETFTDSKDL